MPVMSELELMFRQFAKAIGAEDIRRRPDGRWTCTVRVEVTSEMIEQAPPKAGAFIDFIRREIEQ